MRERISFSLPFFPWGYRTTETLCVLLHQRRSRFPPRDFKKELPLLPTFSPVSCVRSTSPLFFLGSHAYTYAERRPTPTSFFLPYTSPFSFAFFPPLSPPGASGEHTHVDGRRRKANACRHTYRREDGKRSGGGWREVVEERGEGKTEADLPSF